MGRGAAPPSGALAARLAVHAVMAAVCFATPASAQDSIAVIDRGTPPARIWSVVEFPFKLLQVPIRLAEGAVAWLAARAEKGGWVSAARRADQSLDTRGVRLGFGGQGANSSVGPTLNLGRGPRLNRRVWLQMQSGVTLRGYWRAEARAGAHGAEAFAGFADRPQEAFFGIGNATREQDWSDYRLRRWRWGARASLQASAHVDLAAALEWTRVETSHGTADGRPDIDSTFPALGRPGFGETHRYFWLSAGAEWRAGARHSLDRRGSWVGADYRLGRSHSGVSANIGLLHVTAGVEAAFDHRRRSLGIAASFESLHSSSAGVVPFYLLPTLGGPQSLPSFQTERFRGRNVLMGKVEYRYRVWSDPSDVVWLDAAWFTTAGIVTDREAAVLSTARLHQSSGFAIALITRQTALARVGLSGGAEGFRLTFAAGTSP